MITAARGEGECERTHIIDQLVLIYTDIPSSTWGVSHRLQTTFWVHLCYCFDQKFGAFFFFFCQQHDSTLFNRFIISKPNVLQLHMILLRRLLATSSSHGIPKRSIFFSRVPDSELVYHNANTTNSGGEVSKHVIFLVQKIEAVEEKRRWPKVPHRQLP
ncbi:hypothetical protein B9Z55_002489 [Caenorhabditis nigoni]|uniref:Uncharacterized protein n=1 Tax=Caenorhabditis nigoni TaxID=1611254 RepID=A0A2G5VL00_9PELO|nr:hypothetical protein B9Z55_002489 [Caenorhabditis nigoni]